MRGSGSTGWRIPGFGRFIKALRTSPADQWQEMRPERAAKVMLAAGHDAQGMLRQRNPQGDPVTYLMATSRISSGPVVLLNPDEDNPAGHNEVLVATRGRFGAVTWKTVENSPAPLHLGPVEFRFIKA
jgi:hypothetical protein